MIPVANPIPEPADFDAECRKKGQGWIDARRLENLALKSSEFPSYWGNYEGELAAAFRQRCGWWAMWISDGEVDHYLSKKNRPDLAYEWSNYRYIAGSVNGSKGNHDDKVLDPFEIQEDWFEVLLPSMQLIITDQIPEELRVKANFTITQLHLDDGKKVVRCRQRWYESYKNGMPLTELEKYAPLIANAVKKWEAAGLTPP
jgi:hypothetical protein